MRKLPLALALMLGVLVAGCGGGGSDDDSAPSATEKAGLAVFNEAGCGGCHALDAAGSNGTIGPNLDETQLDRRRIAAQVRTGGNGMPAFDDQLSAREIEDVAAFVAESGGDAEAGTSVAGRFEPDDKTLSACASGDNRCFEQAFGNLAFERGARVALGELDARMRSDPAVLAGCHRMAHSIGAASLARSDGNVAKAFVEGTATCASGFYHGLIERAFVGVPENRLAIAADRVCSANEIRADGFRAYQCVHGLGHGLMIYTGFNLPQSLRVCDDLSNEFDSISCTGGVFMENGQSSYGVRSKWLKDDDLIYPCNKVAERHKYYCYLLVTSRILPAVDGSMKRTAQVCRQSEPAWVDECFESFGRDAAGQVQQDGVRVIPLCRLAGANESDCVYGAARDIANADAHGRRAAAFCDKVRQAHRTHCFEGVGTIVGSLNTYAEERVSECRKLTRRYADACARGAGVRTT